MTRITINVFLTALLLSSSSAFAATTPDNTDDGSAIGTSKTPQIKHQDKRIDKKTTNKSMKKNNRNNSDKDMEMMDTNSDGMVTRDEYMTHQEIVYAKMPQTENGGVSYKNSMNNKPIGTTTGESQNGSVDITKDGPGNGTAYGTN